MRWAEPALWILTGVVMLAVGALAQQRDTVTLSKKEWACAATFPDSGRCSAWVSVRLINPV